MSLLVYVETTIPSFYTEKRKGQVVEVRRKWTREWWARPKPAQQLVTSALVFDELQRIPDVARRNESIALLRDVEALEYTVEVEEVAAVYLQHKLMPAGAFGDADHLALASFYNCDILVTWNCKHLANANKTGHIRRVNALLGLRTPLLVTPLELLEKVMNPKPDETLEEIWTIRRQIAKKFAADPRQRVAYYQRIQRESGAKIYRPEVPAGAGLHAPVVLHDRARATATASPSATPTSYRAARKRKAKPAQ